jgi:hypothetical protein
MFVNVTFNESGLPSGTTWSVTLGGIVNSSTTTTIGFIVMPGMYVYSISGIPGWHQTNLPYNGMLNVPPMNVYEPTLDFVQVTYSVTFPESGLPPGQTFQVTLGGVPESVPTNGGMNTLTFTEPNGTYGYSITPVSGWNQSTLPYSGSVVVNNASVPEPTLVFTQETYAVEFSESGLPSGLHWMVSVDGMQMNLMTNGTTDTLTWPALANGTYDYSITGIPGWYQSTLPYSGSVVVNGAPVTEPTLVYSQFTYSVTFSESGLPAALTFQVTVNGVMMSLTTNGGTDPLTWTGLANGTYPYSIAGIAGWHQTTLGYSGNVMVNGASVTEPTLAYTAYTYSVTFSEGSLPGGTTWYVNVTSPSQASRQTNMPKLMFSEPNGTYDYTVATSDSNYRPVAPNGEFTIAGSGNSTLVVFQYNTYLVTFTETGLPTGATWIVDATPGTPGNYSAQTTVTFYDQNGKYTYTVRTTDPAYAPTSSTATGPFTVSGAPAYVSVVFIELNFTVTFNQTGLLVGHWYVNITNYTTGATVADGNVLAGSPYLANLSNGTYLYSAAAGNPKYAWIHTTNSFVVDGGALAENVTFAAANYRILFSESGLPTATNWSVTFHSINGTLHRLTHYSTNSTIAFYYANGTYYNFSVASTNKIYAPLNGTGSFNITGLPVNETVPFYEVTYKVTIVEMGLPLGANWTATFGGVSNWSVTPTMVFYEPNGTYLGSIALIVTYTDSPSSFSIKVNGAAYIETITFSPDSAPFRVTYLLGGILVAVVIGAIAVVLISRGRRPPPVSRHPPPGAKGTPSPPLSQPPSQSP